MHRVTAVVVNWNSGDDLARLLVDLRAQTGVDVSILVVDNGSADTSVKRALETGVAFQLHSAGQNLGYTGGNNLAAELAGPDADLFVVNPDVRLPDPATVARLADALATDATLAAVAPAIEVSPGLAEYLGSEIDLERVRAVHTLTDVAFPADVQPRALSRIDGAALLVRAEARREIGFFDDRFFLIWDEVEWCVRATRQGWRVALYPGVRINHQRSSSFAGSNKSAYYYWRNLYLICRLHASSRWTWRRRYVARLARFTGRPAVLRSPRYALVVLRGAFDGVRGRVGPGPEDI